jgi:hypothetical protein
VEPITKLINRMANPPVSKSFSSIPSPVVATRSMLAGHSSINDGTAATIGAQRGATAALQESAHRRRSPPGPLDYAVSGRPQGVPPSLSTAAWSSSDVENARLLLELQQRQPWPQPTVRQHSFGQMNMPPADQPRFYRQTPVLAQPLHDVPNHTVRGPDGRKYFVTEETFPSDRSPPVPDDHCNDSRPPSAPGSAVSRTKSVRETLDRVNRELAEVTTAMAVLMAEKESRRRNSTAEQYDRSPVRHVAQRPTIIE